MAPRAEHYSQYCVFPVAGEDDVGARLHRCMGRLPSAQWLGEGRYAMGGELSWAGLHVARVSMQRVG